MSRWKRSQGSEKEEKAEARGRDGLRLGWLSGCLNSRPMDSIRCPFFPRITLPFCLFSYFEMDVCHLPTKRPLTKTTVKPCYQLLNISRIFLKTKTNFFLFIEYTVSKNVHMLLMYTCVCFAVATGFRIRNKITTRIWDQQKESSLEKCSLTSPS